MKRVCIVTGSRAEYGLLRPLLQQFKNSKTTELQLVVTGMHLNHEFGSTWKLITADGFKIDHKVQMLLGSDTPNAVSKSVGLGLIGFADVLDKQQPDLLIVLGDRFEMLPAAVAAVLYQVPLAHIHGGELTHGAYDDQIRHAITKMASLHFVATEDYRRRVIQMGETPTNVWNVGGLGVDSIAHTDLMSLNELEKSLDFQFADRNLLVTFHPETSTGKNPQAQIGAVLAALETAEANLIFTMPNADNDGRVILDLLKIFVEKNKTTARLYPSLGQKRYYSAIKYVDGVVGNSSSGLLEVPSFKKGTINVGARQQGRIMAESIISCDAEFDDIKLAIEKLYSSGFREKLNNVTNPYGQGGAAKKIFDIIDQYNLRDLKKTFHDSNGHSNIIASLENYHDT